MSLAQALAAQSQRPRGPACTVALILAKLDDDDRATLLNALGDVSVRHSDLARALTAEGHPIKESTISRHRLNGCSCGVV